MAGQQGQVDRRTLLKMMGATGAAATHWSRAGMSGPLPSELIEALQGVDSPTLSNAIETFEVRERTTGFMSHRVRCMFPELGVSVGYAVTAQIDTTSPESLTAAKSLREFAALVEASPKPVVLVYQDVGPRPGAAACIGEYSASLMQRLGAVALVCDGAVRDFNEVRALGFQCFALGSSVSHGTMRRLRWDIPVVVDGLRIEPGELIHGDVNGVLSVPTEIAPKLPAEVEKIRAKERDAIDFIASADFDLDSALKRMGH